METEKLEAQDQGELAACRNCGAPVNETFCAACGEKMFVPGEHSLKHFFGDIVNALTFLDTKFLRTLKLMITRPGAMSYQYINGKRVSFIKPVSMFFIANLVYFLFPLFNSLDSSLSNQMYHLPHSVIAERMVKEEFTLQIVRTGCPTQPGTDHPGLVAITKVFSFDWHSKYLITLNTPGLVVRLESDALAVETPVCLSVVRSERKLSQVFQVFLLGVPERVSILSE